MESTTQNTKSTTMTIKKRKKQQSHRDISNKSRVFSTPRTRSQVAPDWTTKEALILVNEIAAVEGDCLKALSSHQKWKIIVDNCTSLDVTRTLNQCRSKWNSLLAEYNQIKKWDKDSKSRSDFYWSLECERRKEYGLPENFDDELFKAIDAYIWAQKEQPDMDPGTDAEAEADMLDVIAKLASKRQRRRSMPLKTPAEEKTERHCKKEKSQTVVTELEAWERYVEEDPQTYSTTEGPQKIHAEEEHQASHVEEKSQTYCTEEKLQTIRAEEEFQESCVDEMPHAIHAGEEPEESPVEEQPQTCWSKEMLRTIHVEEGTQGRNMEENNQTSCTMEKPQTIPPEEEPQETLVEKKPQNCWRKEKPQNGHGDGKPKIFRVRKKKVPSAAEKEQMMVEKLCENAELILAVVNGNLPEMADFGVADSKNIEGFKTDRIRRQGDVLISCLENIVNAINQFPCLVQEGD